MPSSPARNNLPPQVDPRKLAAQGTSLNGGMPTARMQRLRDLVLDAEDRATTELSFFRDEEGRSKVEGVTQLRVSIQCQRCLQPVEQSLNASVHLAVVWDEEHAEKLPASLEPWILPEESGDLVAMIEDELLLALPIVAYHDTVACLQQGSYSTGEIQEEKENPFSVLAQLKVKQ